ncbi:phage holin family protein [Enorma phocaeensis]|uniref:phage holin family protein n=1 Tax=Enorma phocaeensis TaxID=1871019 RepID=UPI000C84EE81|nr:phage holin family protein [Enorma phocaeensis]
MTFLLNWLFTSIAIAIADYIVPGIFVMGTAEVWLCYVFTGLFLSLVNSIVKPIMTLLCLPLTIITLGIFQLVVNGLMLQLASSLSLNLLETGIVIDGFGAAFGGAIIVSIMCTILGVRKS